MQFEYDLMKSFRNFTKHGIDFEAAQELWRDPYITTVVSKNAGNDDARYITIGKINDIYWAAITTYRSDNIRIISVRRARKKEIAYYDEQKERF